MTDRPTLTLADLWQIMQLQQQQAQARPEGAPLETFRPGVPTPYGRDAQQMREQNGAISASQTQYANDRPIQNFRPGIPNPIWGWGRQ